MAEFEVVVFKTCFPNTSNNVIVLSALASDSMNNVPFETGLGYIFNPGIVFCSVFKTPFETVTLSNRIVPVGAYVFVELKIKIKVSKLNYPIRSRQDPDPN